MPRIVPALLSAALSLMILSASAQPLPSNPIGAQSGEETPSESESQEMPEWFKYAEKIKGLIGSNKVSTIENVKLLRRFDTPIAGLDALVVQADITPIDGEPYTDLFVFYVDKQNRYLLSGIFINMEKQIEYSRSLVRYARGQFFQGPEKSLNPLDMYGVAASPFDRPDTKGAMHIVTSLKYENQCELVGRIEGIRQQTIKEGKKPAPVFYYFISDGTDETSAFIGAMIMGYDRIEGGNGYAKLLEFCAKGRSFDWTNPNKIKSDPYLKKVLAYGLQAIEENSSAALYAKIDRIPLLYLYDGGHARYVEFPRQREEFESLVRGTFLKK